MKNNNLLLEFNKSDLETIVSNSDSFTIAYEIELEADEEDLKEMIEFNDKNYTYEEIYEWALENDREMPTKIILKVIDFEKILDKVFKDEKNEFIEIIANNAIDDSGVTDDSVAELIMDLTQLNYLTDIYEEDREVKLIFVKNILKNEKVVERLKETLPIQISNPNQIELFNLDTESLLRYLESLSNKDHFELIVESVLDNLSEEEFKKMMNEIWDKKFQMLKSKYVDELDLSLDEEKDYFDELKDILILDPDRLSDNINDIRNKILNYILNLDPSSDFYYEEDKIRDIFDETGIFDMASKFYDELSREREDKKEDIADAFAYYLINVVGADYFFEEFPFLEQYRDDLSSVGNVDDLGDFFTSNKGDFFASAFPNFWNKWGSDLDIVEDGSLKMGIEVVHGSYLKSIEEAMEFLDDFYADYNKQTVFMFHDTTGLHTNIGYKGNYNTEDWNLFKAYLFLNESFATRGFENRIYNRYSGPVKKIIENYLKNQLKQPLDNMNFNVRSIIKQIAEKNPNFFSEIEESMNNIIENQSARGAAYSGFTIRSNRIEFRYPGGEMNKADLKSATMYYCYLVELATNPEYKRRDYLLKAVKFIANTISEMKEGVTYTYKNTKIKMNPKFSKKYLERFISENGPYIIPYKGSYLGLPNLYGYELTSLSPYLNKSYFKNNFKRDDLISYQNISELCVNSYENLKSKIHMEYKALVKITNIDEEKNLVELKWASALMSNLFQINIYDSDYYNSNPIEKYDVSFPVILMDRNKSIRLDKLVWLIQNNDVESDQGRLDSLDLIFSQMSEREKTLEFMKYVNPNLAAIYEILSQKGVRIINISDESNQDYMKIYDYLTKIK